MDTENTKPDIFNRPLVDGPPEDPKDPYTVIPGESKEDRRRRLDRARKQRNRGQAKKARAKAKAQSGNSTDPTENVPSRKARVREMRQRIDGKLGGQRVSAEAKLVIREAVETYYHVPLSHIAKALGFGENTVRSVVADTPELLAALATKRASDTKARMELLLSEMMGQLEDAVFRAELRPTTKTFRDWSVAFGILFDKKAMLSGDDGGVESSTGDESVEAMKARMLNVIDGAHETLKVIQGGGNGRRRAGGPKG